MPIRKIFAQLACRDLDLSAAWYGALFGRRHDAQPMDGLREWYHGDGAGFQLLLDAGRAGGGSLTLIVGELQSERRRLADLGLAPGEIVAGTFAAIFELQDVDGNRVVLAEPNGSTPRPPLKHAR